jgi:hypothetical protein
MNKECPHCYVDAFSLRDLFSLDYFHPSECSNCGGLIRNSGWSQFLGPATTMFWFVVMVTLGFRFLPEWLVASILILTLPLPWLIFAKPVRADTPKVDLPPFSRDPHNDKLIITRGWNETELRGMIDDFVAQNTGLPFEVEIIKRFERDFCLTFPADIHSFDYLALINYLNYPIDFPASRHSIDVIGKATLTSDFQGVQESLIGEKALFYIPENDKDFDLVFVDTATNSTLKFSLSEQVWQPASSRMPPGVRMLSYFSQRNMQLEEFKKQFE